MTRHLALVGIVSSLVSLFGLTLIFRYIDCRILHEFDTDTGYRSHQAIREECRQRIDPLFLLRS